MQKLRENDIVKCVSTRQVIGQSENWAKNDGLVKGCLYRIINAYRENDWWGGWAVNIKPVDGTPPLTLGLTHAAVLFKKVENKP